MLPPWTIEKLEQERREREAQERPRLEIEIQPPSDEARRPERQPPATSSVITIQVW